MSGHTPGPWAQHERIIYIVSDDRRCNHFECLVQHSYVASMDELLANARLIAAAPDLLAALLEALEFVEDYEDVVDGSYGMPAPNRAMQLATSLRDSIKKATGTTP